MQIVILVLAAPVIMLVGLVLAIWASQVIAATGDVEKRTPARAAQAGARMVCRGLGRLAPIMQTPWAYIVGAAFWALVIYLVIVRHAFAHLETELTKYAAPQEFAVFEGRPRPPSDNELADAIIAASGIQAKPDEESRRAIARAVHDNIVKEKQSWRLPALPTAIQLALDNHSCAEQTASCREALLTAVAHVMVGNLPSVADADRRYLMRALEPVQGEDHLVRRGPGGIAWALDAITAQRSVPIDPGSLAKLLIGKAAPDPDAVVPKVVQHLLQAALDSDRTRSVLTYEVGIFYGWERLVVLVLFLCVVHALIYRECARVPLEEQAEFVHEELRALAQARSPTAAHDGKNRLGELTQLCTKFDERYPRLHMARDKEDRRPQDATNADPHLHPIAGLLSATRRSLNADNPRLISVAAEDVRSHMERWRETLNGVITLFPVIGFSATLLGLIAAFSVADRVAVFAGLAKATAVRAMVSELSACFATTFLALLAMALLTLFSMRQAQCEHAMVERLGIELDAMFGTD